MENLAPEIIDGVVLLVTTMGGGYGIFRAVLDSNEKKTERTRIEAVEVTNQKRIEEEQRTAREIALARENSVGASALLLIRTDIDDAKRSILELNKAKDHDGIKIQEIESIIKSLEFTYRMIENRMLQMFPQPQSPK